MDAFQGCYRDGTDGTHDCRYFAVDYPLFRIILVYAATLSTLFYAIRTVILLLTAILLVIVQPYKKFAADNTTDTVLILLFVVIMHSLYIFIHVSR